MKTFFTLLLLNFFVSFSFAQPGTPDLNFGDSGKVLTGGNSNNILECFASAVQTDNKTVVVGYYGSTATDGFLVLRYLTNGEIDSSFGHNGSTIINFGYDYQQAQAITIQKDGKILITGYSFSGMFDVNYDIPIVRLNADGSLDSTFGNKGKVIADFSDGDHANSICIQSDGKIVVGGYYDNVDFLLIRYNANGSWDSTFGDKGKVITKFSSISTISSIAIQTDGKIVVGGITDAGESKFEVGRYNSYGTPDSSFGINGFVTTDFGINDDQIRKIIIQPDQKIIAVGSTGISIAVARYKPNGSLDNTFGKDGKSTLKYAGKSAIAYDVAIQVDNKVVIVGPLTSNTDEDYLLARLNPDGSIDSSFGTNGSVITDFSNFYDEPWSVNIRNDNIIVAAGSSSSSNYEINDVSLAAYNEFGKKQSIAIKIRRWLQHHNGIEWSGNRNVKNYVVQRSNDNVQFNSIATINATSQSQLTYQDTSAIISKKYYRLQTVSINGNINYSNVIAITNDDIKVSPNPATSILHIEGLSSNKTKLTIVDIAGNIKLQTIVNASSYNLNIALLQAGNYLLKIEMNDEIVTKQFVKE